MNHDPFKINEAILDLWRDLKGCEEYIHNLEIRNSSLVSERERIEPELEQRCRELNLSLAQQAIQLKQIGKLKAEVERLKKIIESSQYYFLSIKLTDENARLRKAGDGVLNSLDLCYMGNKLHLLPSVIAWNAAKEGKPHA